MSYRAYVFSGEELELMNEALNTAWQVYSDRVAEQLRLPLQERSVAQMNHATRMKSWLVQLNNEHNL